MYTKRNQITKENPHCKISEKKNDRKQKKQQNKSRNHHDTKNQVNLFLIT